MDEDFEQGSSAIRELTQSITNLMNANKQAEDAALARAKADKESAEETKKKTEEDTKYKASKKQLTDASKQLGSEFIKMTEAGMKFAATIGTQATQGVRLELQNRLAAVKQIFTLDANRAANLAQIQAAEQSLTDTFVGVREGLQLSADGAAQFANNLKGGFKSEFQLTNESLRALVTTGMSTTAQFESFRRASGRASLSSNQFASIVSKNTLSFLLYGNKFAEAASKAERLGINLASVQAAQEGLVTNLDGTIDTVAQLNQLGAQIDFGNLVRIAETEGPDALMAYVRATVPEQMMQSASTRALFKQLGISVEDYMKSGKKQESAASDIERQMTKAATETSAATNGMTFLTRAFKTGMDTFGSLIIAILGTIKALNLFSIAAAGKAPGMAATAGGLSKVLSGVTGLGIGIGGATMGRSLVEQGNVSGGLLSSILGGAGGGAMVGSAFGGIGAVPGAIIGALLATGYALTGTKKAQDLYSAGYGNRTLITPSGMYALNNADDIIAGTNLFPKGSLQMGSNNSELTRKMDRLIDMLTNATTTVNISGLTQTVPRMQLVGVYSRNEVV